MLSAAKRSRNIRFAMFFAFLLICVSAPAAFTEFYCQSGGSNVNAGSTTSNTAAYTATNGGWNSGTGIFTPTSGNPSLSVAVGDFASVYTDGATVTGFVGRVTAVSSTTITVSITAKSGTIPTTAGTGITCKTGGAWKGPNAAVGFPFGTVAATMTNAAGDFPRVNFKNDATYSITAALSHAVAGPLRFQGYTSSVGDGGKATIDGGTTGTSYAMLTITGAANELFDLICQNNGATGSAAGITVQTGNHILVERCVVNNVRGHGFMTGGGTSFYPLVECEAYKCGQNDIGFHGFAINGFSTLVRCISHDNGGNPSSAANGFDVGGANVAATFISCIAESNKIGIREPATSSGSVDIIGCDFYNNVSDGVAATGASGVVIVNIENSNFVKNGGYGFNGAGGGTRIGRIKNCGFGSGTQANTSGATNSVSGIELLGSVTYASGVTPWVDPANGDFKINLAAAKGTGRGAFLQTAASYAGTIAYPDIGAAQHRDTGGRRPQVRTP